MAKEDHVNEFVNYMKEEFAKIPKNLTVEEMNDRADRCLSLSETFRAESEIFKAKKYDLLSKKYKQLALEKQHPELFKKEPAGIPAQAIIEEIPSAQPEKKSFWKRFLAFFAGEEVKVEIKKD